MPGVPSLQTASGSMFVSTGCGRGAPGDPRPSPRMGAHSQLLAGSRQAARAQLLGRR